MLCSLFGQLFDCPGEQLGVQLLCNCALLCASLLQLEEFNRLLIELNSMYTRRLHVYGRETSTAWGRGSRT
jgi:hypothetical protein